MADNISFVFRSLYLPVLQKHCNDPETIEEKINKNRAYLGAYRRMA